jgi:hypothetical protein
MDVPAVSDPQHPVVFGVFRDGDNNLDEAQERNVSDFIGETARNRDLKVVAEDTTALESSRFPAGELRTESSIIEDGKQQVYRVQAPLDMSDRATLADFVARSLAARAADPKFAAAPLWIDLVDHGGGDGGGLQSDSSGGFMSIEDIAGAIEDGRARFSRTHPGANNAVEGVVANQCLMATLGFADSLSRVGVKYLAASPETMLTPGVPSAKVADALTRPGDWAQNITDATMRARYGPAGESYHPAAAFDVFDLNPEKMAAVRTAVRSFNDAVAQMPHATDSEELRELRSDVESVKGMARFDHSATMPWHADRPAIAVYDRVAADSQLPDDVRDAAKNAAEAIGSMVMAHRESNEFGPFHASYSDAAGPTVHLPTTRRSYDGWADAGVSETHNRFFDAVDGREFARAIGSYNREEDTAGEIG